MEHECKGCPHCDYELRTDPIVTLAATTTSERLVRGDGARHALCVSIEVTTTADPETQVLVGVQRGASFLALAALTVQAPTQVLRYDDYGDLLYERIDALSNVATITTHAVSVRHVPKGH